MIKCKPVRSGKQTAVLMISFAVLAVATGILSAYHVELGIPAIVGRIGFGIVISVALYYMIKYTLADYEYELTADTLSIVKTVGRKRTVMGALDLSMSVALISKEEFKKDKKKHGTIDRNFNYRQNPFGNGMIYIFEFSDKLYSVDFEPNEPFVNALYAAIDNCKNTK